MKLTTTSKVVAAVAAAFLLGGTLAGCTGGDDAKNTPEKTSTTAGSNADGGSSATGEEALAELPKGFPKAEGEVTAGSHSAENQWGFVVKVEDEAAQEAALKALLDAGYTQTGENKEARIYSFSNEEEGINVSVVLRSDDSGHFVDYNVVKA